MNNNRLESIDQFRGFAIVTMVLANYLMGVVWVPGWLKHAPDVGLTVIDLIAPFFIFSIGLTYGLSVKRRAAADGWTQAIWHNVKRYLGIIGMGAILTTGEIVLGQDPSGINWGVLQAIGAAGLVALLVIRLPTWARALVGAGLLGLYQALLSHGWLAIVLGSPHGGVQGALDWSAMLILATVLADLFHDEARGRRWFLGACFLVIAVGVACSPWSPISKNRVSPTYVLVALGASGLLFMTFNLLVDWLKLPAPLLTAWGKNPFLLYFLHQVLLGLIVLPGIAGWYAEAPGWLVVLQALGLLAILSAVAWWLEKKKLVFTF